MAPKAAVSVEEYLALSFDGPTPELVDGEIVERGEAMLRHSKAQSALLYLLRRAGDVSSARPRAARHRSRLLQLRDPHRVADVVEIV